MPNRKFYIEYFINNSLQRRPIRRWADENRHVFPRFNFTNTNSDYPTTHAIAYCLENQYSFEAIQRGNEIIIRNTNRNFIGFNI